MHSHMHPTNEITLQCTQLKQQMKPLFLLFPCGKWKYDGVPVWWCHSFPYSTFFPLHGWVVSPTQGTEHHFREVMFPSHSSCCCAFSLSPSLFSGPFISEKNQTPQHPWPCHCVKVDTNQRILNLSEHNTVISMHDTSRQWWELVKIVDFSMQCHCYSRLLYFRNLEEETKGKVLFTLCVRNQHLIQYSNSDGML